MSTFSNNLKFLREEKKLSQNKLAELAGVNQTTIARWENEEISPSLDNIYDLANALQVNIATLTDENLLNSKQLSQTEVLFDKTKDILSDDDRATIEFIMKKTIDNYEKNKNNQ
ncbi:TPA: helix-turn-helix transcriptional regulator [Candidatus Ventrenecus stercoripullorum]|nr:helix-turn-helix transcriptional regulator [Candidatus Ventrenecus stercoripullorum]